MHENSNEVLFTKILEIQINSFCHLGLKPNECMPTWKGNSQEAHPVMSSPSSLSYLLSPRSRMVSMSGRAEQNYKDFLYCFLKIAVASAMCCLLFPFHSHSRLLRQRSVAMSHLQ